MSLLFPSNGLSFQGRPFSSTGKIKAPMVIGPMPTRAGRVWRESRVYHGP
jgi:hypothetical protein